MGLALQHCANQRTAPARVDESRTGQLGRQKRRVLARRCGARGSAGTPWRPTSLTISRRTQPGRERLLPRSASCATPEGGAGPQDRDVGVKSWTNRTHRATGTRRPAPACSFTSSGNRMDRGYVSRTEYAPVVERAYAGIIKKARTGADGLIDVFDCSSIGIQDDFRAYINSPKEVNPLPESRHSFSARASWSNVRNLDSALEGRRLPRLRDEFPLLPVPGRASQCRGGPERRFRVGSVSDAAAPPRVRRPGRGLVDAGQIRDGLTFR